MDNAKQIRLFESWLFLLGIAGLRAFFLKEGFGIIFFMFG